MGEMERAEKLRMLADEVVKLIKEFREEACVLGENPLCDVFVNDSNDIVIFENGIKEPVEYSLSEIGYIFEDDIEGFNNCGKKFKDGLDLAMREATLEYCRLSKEEFSNYIGRVIYAQFRCEEIYNRILQIELETREL